MKCPDCGCEYVYKRGVRHNKHGKPIQKYSCNQCGAIFGDTNNVRRMKHTKEEIETVLYLIEDTFPIRLSDIKHKAEQRGINITTKTIKRWIEKYDPDFNSGNGLWKRGDQIPEPNLVNIYLNGEYKCMLKSGDRIPPELVKNKPCTIKVEAVK